MKQVGEAVRDFSTSSSYKAGEVITIGVATWGAVHNRQSLINVKVSGPGLQAPGLGLAAGAVWEGTGTTWMDQGKGVAEGSAGRTQAI